MATLAFEAYLARVRLNLETEGTGFSVMTCDEMMALCLRYLGSVTTDVATRHLLITRGDHTTPRRVNGGA